MNFKVFSQSEKAIFIGISIIGFILFGTLIFALVYANPENIFKKYALIIGFAFIASIRLAAYYYKNIIRRKIS